MTEGKETLFHVMTVGSFSESSLFRYARFSKLKESNVVINVGQLFSLSPERLYGTEAMEATRKLLNAIKNIQVHKVLGGSHEKVSFFSVVKEVLALLGDEVCLSSNVYDTLEDAPDNITIDHIGIGSVETLHGYPDSNIRATKSAINCVDTSSGGSSPGDHMYAEAKSESKNFNLHQLVATAIVTSFTEHNLHSHLNPLVPVVMLCASTAVICLHDCVNDGLLLTDPFELITYDTAGHGSIVKKGIFLL